MSLNNRIFYACQAVAFQPLKPDLSAGPVLALHGVQSVGLNTTFNLEQVFELGQIHIYENIENVPDVEVTLEKVLDGYPLMYHAATSGVTQDSATNKASLVARSKQRTNVILGIFPDTVESVADGDVNAEAQVLMSGMYVSSIGYTLPTDGNCTESLTLVGNHKAWSTTLFTSGVADQFVPSGYTIDRPVNLSGVNGSIGYGGIQRRENVDIKNSALPTSIYGTVGSGVGNGWNSSSATPRVHIQNCAINVDLNRESIQELGRKSPYYRFASFPVEVTCSFDIISISGDFINALESGDTARFPVGTEGYGNNTAQDAIVIRLHDGTIFDLGTSNRLSSVNYTGGDATGGNATMTYNYSTFNSLTVTHPQDPAKQTNDNYAAVYNGA